MTKKQKDKISADLAEALKKDDGLEINPWAQWEEKLDPDMPTATLQIYRQVEKDLMGRDNTFYHRASAMGYCVRRRWYHKNGYEPSPFTPRKILNFAAGDIGEHVIKHFILKGCVGPGKLYSEVDFGTPTETFIVQHKEIQMHAQQTVKTMVNGFEVLGHADGWGKRDSDGLWEHIEIKTAAPFGFDKFKAEGPDDSYIKQAHILMKSDLGIKRNIKHSRFFFMNKATGNIWDQLIDFDPAVFEEMEREILLVEGKDAPDRPFEPIDETYYRKPTGRQKLFWACSYCSFTAECWPEAKKEFKSGRPIWYTKEIEQQKKGSK